MRAQAFERGIALVCALLLLLVTTILGVTLIRSFSLLENSTPNTHEKQRALHSAEAAQTYAEWWLTQSQGRNATTGNACPARLVSNLANTTICNVALTNPATLPWKTGFYYFPPGMSTGNSGAPGNYASAPLFHISFLNSTRDSTTGTLTNAYQVDAVGYAGTTSTAAVVESTYNLSVTHTSQASLRKFIDIAGPETTAAIGPGPLSVGPAQTYDMGVTFTDSLWGSNDLPREASYDAFRTAQRARPTVAYMPEALRQSVPGWPAGATLVSGDVFYGGAWHTWLVGGLGAGEAAIYSLDITNPGKPGAAATNGQVASEWSSSNLTCVNVSNCQKNLGNTYGAPLIRRFHNGSWGVIFGNGYGSPNNSTAGIYIMLIDPGSGERSFYYLATPPLETSAANGIASPASADIDLDHIVDYVYAGDMRGNLWRFDVTSTDPANWAVTGTKPLFAAPSGSAITGGLTVSILRQFVVQDDGRLTVDTSKPARIIVNFGTGQRVPQQLTATRYAPGHHYLFGIWDWNFTRKNEAQPGWNARSTLKVAALGADKGPATITTSMLQSHTMTTVPQTAPAVTYRTISREPVCWVAHTMLDTHSACPNPGTQYGWYIQLPGAMEQIRFHPVISPDGELVVNTFIPARDSPLSPATHNTGFSIAVAPGTGSADPGGTGSIAESYFTVKTINGGAPADALQLNGIGAPWAAPDSDYLITQTSSGATSRTPVNRHTIVAGKRLKWVQRR